MTPLQRRRSAKVEGSPKAHYEWILQEFSTMESKDEDPSRYCCSAGDDGGERRSEKRLSPRDYALYNDTHVGDHVDLSNMDDLHEAPLVDAWAAVCKE